MASKTRLKKRIEFREAALDKLYDAYMALASGGVKSYMIDDRQVTRLDLPALKEEIEEMEQEIDELEAQLGGTRPRKMFGVLPRDF